MTTIIQPPLAGRLWPAGTSVTPTGLHLSGISLSELAATYGTPAVILDEDDFRARCRTWRRAFAGHDVYYAAKAFLCHETARWLSEEGMGIDVCSEGELRTALEGGIAPQVIVMHGNNKSTAELAAAVKHQIALVVIDSLDEIRRLSAAAVAAGREQRILIRVTPGIDAHTHTHITTSTDDQKFGFSIRAGAAAEAAKAVLASPGLRLVGLHSHLGSQITRPDVLHEGIVALVSFMGSLARRHEVSTDVLDLGGGYAIAYTPDDVPLDIATIAPQLIDWVTRACQDADLPVPRLAVEPGRAVAGPTALTLYRVGTVKRQQGLRTWVAVDGGMSDNIRPALYGAPYSVALANRTSSRAAEVFTVCGRHCESGDVIAKDVLLPGDLEVGDLLAVPASGAYHRSMASTYNMQPRPPVIAVSNGHARPIVRRETLEDLQRLDVRT
ncbi:diaminopimelate decarboxylase [Streptomyces sp. NPDC058701]|uniref:diaminopimelate decarboxylase n=1 Tax=Streptomyces sp. NPDC058701 TaxID=3346608 RepID=UPI00364D96C9